MESIDHCYECLKSGQMDFVGQKQATNIQFWLLWSSGAIGFGAGYIYASFWVTFCIIFAAFILSSLICIPSWPLFNRHPLPWVTIDSQEEETHEEKDVQNEDKIQQKVSGKGGSKGSKIKEKKSK
eukprot:GHVL01014697.1.p1 GENE.GHVL01014697.1~~GHVL01014697.1.p1  ORF type:complete len:125 (+),score=24.77 GHVL01014697.1:21-395(+)